LAEQKVAAAQEKAEKLLESVEDLEGDAETPESIMLNSVGGQDTKGRTDQEVVTPWFKFLWETYRTVLDVTKNNTKLEPLYQSAAHQAFQFCLKYHRKAELRRLCELLRNHLLSLPKYSHQAHAINLNSPESMQMHLDTRFLQLNAVAQLELWQEAFRSIEDIHGLLMLSRKPPKAVMMVNFYEKLAKIFLVGDNLLFHAAGWLKYLAVSTRASKQSEDEQKEIATKVLLSILAVPIGGTVVPDDSFAQYDEASMKMQRLTSLLGMSKVPTRDDLLKEAVSYFREFSSPFNFAKD
jgi:translation initiation factor 3 subunit A